MAHPVDPSHWLYRFAPRDWIQASLGELAQARGAYAQRNGRAGLAGCRRAAGVALNGALAAAETPDARWGRSYMDHLTGLVDDAESPEAVRDAARLLLATPLPGGAVVALRTAQTDTRCLEAAETIMAHALALVLRREAPPETDETADS